MNQIILALSLLLTLCTTTAFAQLTLPSRSVSIASASDVVERWTPDQHLYVKGELGVSRERLSTLESWLDKNAAHWTVVLMHDAAEERFTTADGRRFVGLDAVDYALGHGLANRTAFGELEHPQTKQRDGAVFALFLSERAFTYYASDAQDSRSLGESHWVGELDRPAFRAMRGGGRIVDAVKDTITTINSRLDQVILEEEAAQQRAEQARQQAIAEAMAQIHTVRANILRARQFADQVKKAFPNANGELTSPPLAQWEKSVDDIEKALSDDNVHTLSQQLTALNDDIEGMLTAYAIHEGMDVNAARLAEEIEALHRQSGGQPHASQARELLEQAQQAYANGNLDLKQTLTQVEETLQSGRAAVAAERRRVNQKWARRRLIRNVILAAVAISTAILLVIGVLLNQRRKPSKLAAQKALAERETSVKAEMDRVLRLFERSNEVLGDKDQLAQRGYQGRTQALSNQTLTYVDDLLIMSGEVERVMGEARQLIHPSDPLHQVANAILSSRYERGVNRISGEPLRFDEDSGIPFVLRDKRAAASGDEEPKAITLTFEEVFDAFRKRCDSADNTLDVVESSLLQTGDAIDNLQSRIDQLGDTDRELSLAAQNDGYFDLPALFDSLIPSAQADVDEADNVAGLDPVQAMQQQLPRGNRKIYDATTITRIVADARQQLFPVLRDAVPRLEQLSYRTGWIEERLASFGQRANDLLADADARSVGHDAQMLGEHIQTFGRNVQQCVALADELMHEHVLSIDKLQTRVAAARAEMSSALEIPATQLLAESQAHPDADLTGARQQVAAVEAAINIGNVNSAITAIEALQRHVERGTSIVDESLKVLAQFNDRSKAASDRYQQVEGRLADEARVVADTRHRYAEAALYFSAANETHPDVNATIDTHLEEAQRTLHTTRSALDESAALFRTGRMLAAERMLADAEEAMNDVEETSEEIDAHVDRLKRCSSENAAAFRKLTDHLENLEAQVHDHRTTRRTIDAFERITQAFEDSSRIISAPEEERDPFVARNEIAALEERAAEFDAMIVADRNAHAEATRAVLGAETELKHASALVGRAGRDQIPDSAATSDAIADIRRQESALRDVRRRLESPHQNWAEVAADGTQVNAEVGAQAGRLRGELQRAGQCVEELRRASREVSAAAGYSGGFGVLVRGTPGVDDLESARRALASGDYAHMLQLARSAQAQARHAIMQAQRRIAQRKREEARRAEAARRKRQRIQSHVFSAGGGSSRGGSSSTSSSRPSGSYGSSNSGFSRSGW